MEKIYRLRPMNGNTIDELANYYLWFSKPSSFKDVCDANVSAFIENNDIVIRALRQVLSEEGIEELKVKMQNIGICCFTESIPNKQERENFPKGELSICVEYNKTLLEEFFKTNLECLIPQGFKKVIYFSSGAKVDCCDEGHYLDTQNEDYLRYVSIKSLFQHQRNMDKLIFTLLSTLKVEYECQKEQRLIIGGINFNRLDLSGTGYRIEIPQEAICAIHVYNEDDRTFLESLEGLLPISGVD